jgi:hypothetical protein
LVSAFNKGGTATKKKQALSGVNSSNNKTKANETVL